jgi:hypothetical protein
MSKVSAAPARRQSAALTGHTFRGERASRRPSWSCYTERRRVLLAYPRDHSDRDPDPLFSSSRVSVAVCAHCGGPVVTYASMCPRCGHRASSRGTVVIGGIPVYGSRRRGVLSLVARRTVTMLLVSAAVAGVFFLSHISRPENTHQADDQEEQCRSIEESGEEFEGELSECQTKLARLRAVEHHQMSATPVTLDSTHSSP